LRCAERHPETLRVTGVLHAVGKAAGSLLRCTFSCSMSSKRPYRSTMRETAFTCASATEVVSHTQRTATPRAAAAWISPFA
jgi:hypothetical protein